MSKQDTSNPIITCKYCGKQEHSSTRGKRTNIFCSPQCANAYRSERLMVTKQCEQCGETFSFRSSGERNNAKRRFCSNPCAARWRSAQPGRMELFERTLGPTRGVTLRGKKNPEASARMKTNNPMNNPQSRDKMRRALSGCTFLARGGNGTPTRPQLLLAEATGFPIEYVIPTAPVAGQFPSLPNCYKVDLADPTHVLAIEVDGKSHRQKLWRFLDKRKTEVLNALGWSVLRFSNEEVMTSLPSVLKRIHACIASK